MTTAIKRAISQLALGERAHVAVQTIQAAIGSHAGTLKDEHIVLDGFLATPTATKRLVVLMDDSSQPAYEVFSKLSASSSSFRKAVASSEYCSTAVKAMCSYLGTGAPAIWTRDCAIINDLVTASPNTRLMARTAGQAGAISKLAKLLQQTRDTELLKEAMRLLHNIVNDSAVRAKQAVSEGAAESLANLIVPSQHPLMQNGAMATLHFILTRHPGSVADQQLLDLCATRLAAALTNPISTYKIRSSASNALASLLRTDNLNVSLARRVSKIVMDAGGFPVLVRQLEAASKTTQGGYDDCRTPLSLLGHLGFASAENVRQMVEAGVIEAALPFTRCSIPKIASDAGLFLHSLATMDPEYAGRIGSETIARAAPRTAQANANFLSHLAESATPHACAGCGATSGRGKGVALQQCSACKQVWYCSKQCQLGHWKEHKKDCRAGQKPRTV